jgi:transcriptional regulator with XRE-family HTH domain
VRAGVSFPSLKTIQKIATVLEVPIKEFFDFDEQDAKDKSIERERFQSLWCF